MKEYQDKALFLCLPERFDPFRSGNPPFAWSVRTTVKLPTANESELYIASCFSTEPADWEDERRRYTRYPLQQDPYPSLAARVYHEQRQYERAEPLLVEYYETARRVYPGGHAHVDTSRTLLFTNLTQQRKFSQAESVGRAAGDQRQRLQHLHGRARKDRPRDVAERQAQATIRIDDRQRPAVQGLHGAATHRVHQVRVRGEAHAGTVARAALATMRPCP